MVLLVVVPCSFGIVKMPAEMGLATAAIIAALFFANVERFTEFKVAGMEAKVREAVDKAYAALADVRELSLTLAEPIIDTLAVAGQFARTPQLKYPLGQVKEIERIMQKLGATEAEISKKSYSVYHEIELSYKRDLWARLNSANPKRTDLFVYPSKWDIEKWERSDFEKFVADHSLTKNEQFDERLDDLSHFLSEKTLRRPDVER
jgi:hypothetical protein